MNGRQVEIVDIIKYRTRELTVRENDVQKTWKKYFEDMHNGNSEEQDEFSVLL